MPDTSTLGDSQGVIGLLCTLILGVLSWWNLRRGQRDTHEIAADAQDLQRERFDHERTVQALEERDTMIATLRDEAARVVAARNADRDRFELELDRERTRRDAEREMAREELKQAREDLASLAAVIRGQVENVAAGEGVQTFRANLVSDTEGKDNA